jgi:hypothetical protein
MMTRPFTIDEEVIRRLVLRRDLHELKQTQTRKGRFSIRLWRGLAGLTHHLPIVPRARWS